VVGQAALAMWWDMAPDLRDEFEHWHSHEHFPERLALPGFERASRWADVGGGEGFFVLYELATYEALVSREYLARLNAPTEWSRKMMPHHRNMVRSQCRVLESRGGAVSGYAITVRLSPAGGAQGQPCRHLRALGHELAAQPGLCGAHLLQTDTPAIAPTTEQRIRGLADRTAEWIFIANGYDLRVLRGLAGGALSAAALKKAGATEGAIGAAYSLRLSLAAGESR
jgi:hypothetical protein